jgi:hypothetical protein
LLQRAKEWNVKAHNDSFLLRGMDLQDALQWLTQAPTVKKQEPSELHLEYIKASQKCEAGEIQRLRELNEDKDRQACIAIARERLAYALFSLGDARFGRNVVARPLGACRG